MGKERTEGRRDGKEVKGRGKGRDGEGRGVNPSVSMQGVRTPQILDMQCPGPPGLSGHPQFLIQFLSFPTVLSSN